MFNFLEQIFNMENYKPEHPEVWGYAKNNTPSGCSGSYSQLILIPYNECMETIFVNGICYRKYRDINGCEFRIEE